MDDFGIKELYDVTLKATYNIEVGNRKIEPGEVVAAFDRIQIANFQEHKNFSAARGGSDARALVWWEDTREVALSFTQGVFSKTQFALMTNASLIQNDGKSVVSINCREILETDEKGRMQAKHAVKTPCFVYRQPTGERLYEFAINNNAIYTNEQYQEYLVDYYYDYDNNYDIISVGDPLTNGFLSLEGKMRVKDDTTGQVTTGIIKIPKLRLLSNLSMRLGQDAVPLVGRLDAVAIPTGERGQKKVMEIIFLSDDIDSDM